jgi:putative transcriptional regulator
MSDEEVQANALSDPDNPPLSEERLNRMVIGRMVRQARESVRMSQAEFARAFQINLARLRDAEQARANTDPVFVNYVKLIAADPERARQIIEQDVA